MPISRRTVAFRTATLPADDRAAPLPRCCSMRAVPSDRPLALFPVRLETRFFAQPDGSSELRVRVYPDKIHLDSHETELTAAEQQWGGTTGSRCWRAGSDAAGAEARLAAAGRSLRRRARGVDRAQCCARPTPKRGRRRRCLPTSRSRRRRLSRPPTAPRGDDAAWRRAPEARLLPDRWIAIVHSRRPGRRWSRAAATSCRRSPSVPIPSRRECRPVDRRRARHRRRHALDGRLRCRRAAGMALRMHAHAAIRRRPASTVLFVFGVRAHAAAAQTAPRSSPRCSTRTTTPTGSSSCARHADEQHRRAALGLQRGDTGHQRSFATKSARARLPRRCRSNARGSAPRSV